VASIEVVRASAEVARSRRDLLAAEALVRQQENIRIFPHSYEQGRADVSLFGVLRVGETI
jgi:hypothetical protein